MKERRIIIECGVAETRAALLVGDDVRQFYFGPARGDEQEHPASVGDKVVGRVSSTSRKTGVAFIDIGDPVSGFLQLTKKEAMPAEGALVEAVVQREARGQKGATLKLVGVASDGAVIGRKTPADDAVVQAYSQLSSDGPVHGVDVNDGMASALLSSAERVPSVSDVRHRSGSLFEETGAAEALEHAFKRRLVLADGAMRLPSMSLKPCSRSMWTPGRTWRRIGKRRRASTCWLQAPWRDRSICVSLGGRLS